MHQSGQHLSTVEHTPTTIEDVGTPEPMRTVKLVVMRQHPLQCLAYFLLKIQLRTGETVRDDTARNKRCRASTHRPTGITDIFRRRGLNHERNDSIRYAALHQLPPSSRIRLANKETIGGWNAPQGMAGPAIRTMVWRTEGDDDFTGPDVRALRRQRELPAPLHLALLIDQEFRPTSSFELISISSFFCLPSLCTT